MSQLKYKRFTLSLVWLSLHSTLPDNSANVPLLKEVPSNPCTVNAITASHGFRHGTQTYAK